MAAANILNIIADKTNIDVVIKGYRNLIGGNVEPNTEVINKNKLEEINEPAIIPILIEVRTKIIDSTTNNTNICFETIPTALKTPISRFLSERDMKVKYPTPIIDEIIVIISNMSKSSYINSTSGLLNKDSWINTTL